MYSINIPGTEYRQWRVWFDWTESDHAIFDVYCMDRYPEVRVIGSQWMNGQLYREFAFESEDHYAWFLLQVM